MQHGVAILESTSLTVSVDRVVPERALLVFGIAGADPVPEPQKALVTGWLDGATTLVFARALDGPPIQIAWYLVESPQFSVQRGSLADADAVAQIEPLGAAVSTAFPIATSRDFGGTEFDGDDYLKTSILMDGSGLDFQVGGGDLPVRDWQVVSITDGSVSSGEGMLAATELSASRPIADVAVDQSFVLATWTASQGGIGTNAIEAHLAGSHEIVVARQVTGSVITYHWDIVTLLGARVQSGRASVGVGVLVADVAIASVDRDRSFALLSGNVRGGSTSFVGLTTNDEPSVAWFTTELVADDQLRLVRGTHRDSPAQAEWFVVELP